MPLYMDYHKHVKATFDEKVMAHMLDLKIQDKYSVKYHKWWTNPEEGTIYCLIEGPDKQSCEAVHKESHGQSACSIIEVDPAFFNTVMGNGHHIDYGPMLHSNGAVDLGYRTVLMTALHFQNQNSEYEERILKIISSIVNNWNGREARLHFSPCFIGVFNSPDQAIQCAQDIQTGLSKQPIEFKIGICTGQPVTENDGFFSDTIKLAQRLCVVLSNGQIGISTLAQKLCVNQKKSSVLKTFDEPGESLLSKWFETTETNLSNENFTIDTISKQIGISRPQLYRKITNLSGRSPNDLLRDQRMEKALELLKQKSSNVSQVAFEVGYNNPSYFAKYFREKFGCSPSEFMHA